MRFLFWLEIHQTQLKLLHGLSLAGSRVCKATPDWQQCEQAAATAAGNGGVDAAAVAAAAVQGLQAGLEDGLIELGTQYLF
jgi:hypothetical protein